MLTLFCSGAEKAAPAAKGLLETFLIIVFPTYWTEDKKIIGYFFILSRPQIF